MLVPSVYPSKITQLNYNAKALTSNYTYIIKLKTYKVANKLLTTFPKHTI